ncbi:helix-turn-helix domain-containing protein [Streptomyces rochei]|uniref:helix-turn-helix domain-containing protein n=1 Tax=Streptomyces rochei TaxID=1928 RepID=UPI003466E167
MAVPQVTRDTSNPRAPPRGGGGRGVPGRHSEGAPQLVRPGTSARRSATPHPAYRAGRRTPPPGRGADPAWRVRLHLSLSQQDVCGRSGIDVATYSRIEQGHASPLRTR